MITAEISIPRSGLCISPVQSFFKELYKNLNYPPDILYDLELALEEAITNLFEYAMEKDSTELMRIFFELGEEVITISFRVKARPFNPKEIKKFAKGETTDNPWVEGLEFFVLQQMMDSVEWRYIEKFGQELVIKKKLPVPVTTVGKGSPDILDLTHSGLIPPEEFSADRLQFRLLEDIDEAFALSQLAYDLYDYGYKDVIYFPNELLYKIQNNLIRSWIAVDENKKIYGHYALLMNSSDDKVAETGAAFTHPAYRKSGILNKLAVCLHDDAKQLGLQGLYSMSVTNMTVTQALSERYGRITTRLRYASLPPIYSTDLAPDERITTTLNYQQVTKRPKKRIFVPPVYAEIVQRLYSGCGIEVEISTGSGNHETGNELFQTQREAYWKRALLKVRGGEGSVAKLLALTDLLCEGDIIWIGAAIDIEDPSAFRLIEAARERGFFFCGIFPEFLSGRDTLHMQYLNKFSVDPAKIKIHQSTGKEIFEFTMQEAPLNFKVAE